MMNYFGIFRYDPLCASIESSARTVGKASFKIGALQNRYIAVTHKHEQLLVG